MIETTYIQDLHQLRLECDRLIQCACRLADSPKTVFSRHHLEMAKAHMGKIKGMLGEPSPYTPEKPVGSLADIPPTDAIWQGNILFPTSDRLLDVDQMRHDITALQVDFINKVHLIDDSKYYETTADHILAVNSFDAVIKNLSEAGICYGFEIRRMVSEFKEKQ